MTNTGYIQLQRLHIERMLLQEKRPFTKFEAWVDLLQMAQFEAGQKLVNGQLFDLKPGDLIASHRYLQTRWRWASLVKVQTFLKTLQKQVMVKVSDKSEISHLTICNYGSCEAGKVRKRSVTKSVRGQKEVSERSNKRRKEGKKERRKEEVVATSVATLPSSPEFDLLKKIGKPAAKLWVEHEMERQFTSPAHKTLALTWMTYRCGIGKPLESHAELVLLLGNFNKNTVEALQNLVEYSINGKYPALYFDRLEKTIATQPSTKNGKIITASKFDKYRQNGTQH